MSRRLHRSLPPISTALAVCLSLTLAACTGDSKGGSDEPSTPSPDGGPLADTTAPDTTTCLPEDRCDSPGERACNGAEVLECTRVREDCAVWQSVETCADDRVCSNGACADSCSDECPSAGETGCVSPGGRQTCDDHDGDSCLEWGDTDYCGAGERCEEGTCGATDVPDEQLVISELLYDNEGGDDDTFVEIHGQADTDITGYTLVGVNGNDGEEYDELTLQGSTDSDGRFVVASDTASSALKSKADQLSSEVDYQNGPDNVVLRWDSTEIDALGYGDFAEATFAGEARPHPGAEPGESLARYGGDTDTDDNLADFYASSSPTPGEANDRTDPCRDGDGVCPASCDESTDDDCGTTCGNGQVEGDEECDDGDTTGGDGCSPTCRLEPGETHWSINFGGGRTPNDPIDLASDSAGNIYLAGAFENKITLGGHVFETDDDGDTKDAFLAKFDDQRNFQWAKTFGGDLDDDGATGVAVDSSDNVYVTGWYTDSMTIGTTTHGSGDSDMFLAKFDSSGNYRWSLDEPGVSPLEVAVDDNDNPHVTGHADEEYFGADDSPGGRNDLLVAKYDDAGNENWSTTPESSRGEETGYGIAVDSSGNVYVTGHHDAGFDMASNGVQLPHSDSNPDHLTDPDLFILKLDSSGEALWGHVAGGPGRDYAGDIAIDPTGGAVMAGSYQGGNKTMAGETIDSTGSTRDMILASFQAGGSAEWIKNFGNSDHAGHARGVAVDASGNVFMTGDLDGSANFGGGNVQTLNTDIIVAAYDASGGYRWSKRHGLSGTEIGNDLALPDSQHLYLTGTMERKIGFGDGILDPSTDKNMFLVSKAR